LKAGVKEMAIRCAVKFVKSRFGRYPHHNLLQIEIVRGPGFTLQVLVQMYHLACGLSATIPNVSSHHSDVYA
jgi:hypothetical protein